MVVFFDTFNVSFCYKQDVSDIISNLKFYFIMNALTSITSVSKIALVAISSSVLMIPSLLGTTIFSTDFSDASQATTNGPIAMGGTVASGFQVSTFGKSATATFNIWEYDTSSGGGWDTAPIFAGARPAQLPNSLDSNQSVEFSITNNSGSDISINGFEFNLVRKGFGDVAGVSVWTSLDTFTTPLITFSNDVLAGTKSVVSSGTLSGNDMLDLLNGESITFRFALWTPNSGAGAARLGIDDIQVSVIPEPRMAAFLMGVLVLGVLIFRRRKS